MPKKSALTAREQEIYEHICCGLRNEAIAKALHVSSKTVETHRSHINAKLGVHSPRELILRRLIEVGTAEDTEPEQRLEAVLDLARRACEGRPPLPRS